MMVWVITWAEFDWDYGEPVAAFASEQAASDYWDRELPNKKAKDPYGGFVIYELEVQE